MCDPIIVNPVVKMRPHPAAHLHSPLIRKYPPPSATPSRVRFSQGQSEALVRSFKIKQVESKN